MHTTLLVLHIIGMTTSLVLMAGALLFVLMHQKIAVYMATSAASATGLGGLSGAILLMSTPLSPMCIMLTAYLIGFGLLYGFVFHFGRIQNCAWIL